MISVSRNLMRTNWGHFKYLSIVSQHVSESTAHLSTCFDHSATLEKEHCHLPKVEVDEVPEDQIQRMVENKHTWSRGSRKNQNCVPQCNARWGCIWIEISRIQDQQGIQTWGDPTFCPSPFWWMPRYPSPRCIFLGLQLHSPLHPRVKKSSCDLKVFHLKRPGIFF